LKEAMADSIILLLSAIKEHGYKDMWKTPVCSAICTLCYKGKSYNQIIALTSLKQSTIQGIVKGCTTQKGKATKQPALKQSQIKHIFRFVSES
jgi:hypothetical protein